jgi:hypothetical protein
MNWGWRGWVLQHTPRINNKIGSTGGLTAGPSVCTSCHVHYSTTIGHTMSLATQNNFEPGSDNVYMFCPIGGTFYSASATPESGFEIEVAYTRAISTGTQSNCYWNQAITQEICTISAQPWCTAATSPPDWPVNAVDSQVYPPPPPSWWEAFDICVAYGVPGNMRPWLCLPNGFAVEAFQPPTPPQANCTYNP